MDSFIFFKDILTLIGFIWLIIGTVDILLGFLLFCCGYYRKITKEIKKIGDKNA